MIDGRIFLALATVMSLGLFLNGWRFSRMTQNPWVGRRLLWQDVGGGDLPIEQVRRFGRIQMIAAPIFLLFFAALAFGMFGSVQGIDVLRFQ